MADANVAAIIGNPPPPLNPLQTLSGWQGYANQVQQGRNLQLENQTGQQALAQTMQTRHNQIMAGLLTVPDDQLYQQSRQALDDELATGQIDQQRHDVMDQHLEASKGNPSSIRQAILSGLLTNMQPAQTMQAQSPSVVMQDIGGQIVPRVMPSTTQLLQGQTGVGVAPGAINRTQPPGYENIGGQTVPVGGAMGSPVLNNTPAPQFVDTGGQHIPTSGGQPIGQGINQTLTPGEGTALQPRLVQQPDGSYAVVTQQLQQWNPALAPAGSRGGAPGALGGGNYPQPAVTNMPMGTEGKLQKDQETYQADQNAIPALQTGTQSLGKALNALNAVATGAGTEGLARMRSYAVSLGNVVNVDTGGINVQDMNRAELEKYLTDYARVSGTAGRSDESLNAAFKSNASGSINNAAAQDVVRTNIGRDRQKIAAAMIAPNKQGANYSDFRGNFMSSTDPRGFAWETYTEPQKAAIIKETQGKMGKNSPEYKKLQLAVGYAQQLKMLNFSAPQPTNVNAAP